jgi:hypothetical protein
MFQLNLTPQQAQLLWAAVMELPGKVGFDLALSIKTQLEPQEAALKATAEVQHTPV